MRIFAIKHSWLVAMAASNGATGHLDGLSWGGHSSVSPLPEGMQAIVRRTAGGIGLSNAQDELDNAYGMKLISPQMPPRAAGWMLEMTGPTGTPMRFFVNDDGVLHQIDTDRIPNVDWNDGRG